MAKIPCSVGILTLNSEKTLRRCLDSVKDFAEIVICDGNSTDKTLEIAREYGCKIIKQYDSDQPNLSCTTDKANVRNRNLQATSCDWYFWLDSDDRLSPGLVKEIREITQSQSPLCFVYRVPMRIFIGEREIKYASNYPMYQMRFFNKKTGAYFIKPVHERITFDSKKFRVGTLKNYYDIMWSKERARNFWKETILPYVKLEVETWKPAGLINYLRWGIFRNLKPMFGVILKSSKNYIFHGFKNSMPPKIELARVGHHLLLMWRITKKQFGL
jgi:glycosyltransferase involved in cell wall biosynthesis